MITLDYFTYKKCVLELSMATSEMALNNRCIVGRAVVTIPTNFGGIFQCSLPGFPFFPFPFTAMFLLRSVLLIHSRFAAV